VEVKEFKEVREVKAICFIAKYTKVSDLGRDGLKAQQAHSPGHRPGLRIAIVLTPCKGKSVINMAQSLSKIYIRINAYALTGRH
jgi:hypothetical protein